MFAREICRPLFDSARGGFAQVGRNRRDALSGGAVTGLATAFKDMRDGDGHHRLYALGSGDERSACGDIGRLEAFFRFFMTSDGEAERQQGKQKTVLDKA